MAGLILWMAAHFLKRLVPSARAALDEKLGAGGARGVMTFAILLSVVLMIIGYRSAPYVHVYSPPSFFGHINNLLMVIAVVMLGMGSSKGRARSLMRHPMLTGALVWAIAHLMVNGDVASLILFGGIGQWAIAQMQLINRAEGEWQRPEPGPASGDAKLAVISAVVFVVITGVHTWLGYPPFGGV